MNDDLKATIIVCVTVLLFFSVAVGGILVNRYLRNQDMREATEFSLFIAAPQGFSCILDEGGNSYPYNQIVVTCEKK